MIVNILTNFAVNKGAIRVFGGDQKRPNIHIEDMTDLYLFLLQKEDAEIDGKIYNAGYENHTVMQLAEMVKNVVGDDLKFEGAILTVVVSVFFLALLLVNMPRSDGHG